MDNGSEQKDLTSLFKMFPKVPESAAVQPQDLKQEQGNSVSKAAEGVKDEEDPSDKARRKAQFQPREPRYSFEDLVLPEKVFKDIEVLESMISNHAIVYDTWGLRKIDPYGEQLAFNLFGPSGSGKTMIVEALAKRWRKGLIDVNMAQLESKYVGSTGKNIEAAFEAARESGAVLLFDEADAVLGRRLSEVKQSADSSVNTARSVMLKQLEQHSGIVAFATNFAHNYDTAFVRRILKHINIGLPDEESRKRLFMKKIPEGAPGYGSLDWGEFAKQSESFAGGDILVVVKNALFDAAKRSPQMLTTQIVLDAISDWRIAKENIGQWSAATVRRIKKEDYFASTVGTEK